MDSDSRSYLISVLILLALAFFFALCETAFSCASKVRLRANSERGSRGAEKALSVLDRFEDCVTTLLILTNIVHILLASLVTAMVVRNWGLSFVTLSTIVTTIVVFFAGEMLPKSIAKKKPEFFSENTAGILLFLMKVLRPLSSVLTGIGGFISKRIASEPEPSVTEEEIQDIIEDYEEDGKMEHEQADLLSQALIFSKKTAGEIMTKTEEICALSLRWSQKEQFEFLKREHHSRIPVYRDSIDQISGMLSARKYLNTWYRTGGYPRVTPLLSRVYYTIPGIEIDELLSEMSAERVTMAVVREEKDRGKTLGIITIEDILEELVGDIYDENDKVPKEEKKA